jgi:hypothetical protein
MTQTNVFIGPLSEAPDPLDWGGDYSVGNIPVRLGPFFPPSRRAAFHILIREIKASRLVGKQVDWGAWAATVSKDQIFDFIKNLYEDDRTYLDPTYMPHLYPLLDELRDYVRSLPDESFALVGSEL